MTFRTALLTELLATVALAGYMTIPPTPVLVSDIFPPHKVIIEQAAVAPTAAPAVAPSYTPSPDPSDVSVGAVIPPHQDPAPAVPAASPAPVVTSEVNPTPCRSIGNNGPVDCN